VDKYISTIDVLEPHSYFYNGQQQALFSGAKLEEIHTEIHTCDTDIGACTRGTHALAMASAALG
jgi:hypothetical protein